MSCLLECALTGSSIILNVFPPGSVLFIVPVSDDTLNRGAIARAFDFAIVPWRCASVLAQRFCRLEAVQRDEPGPADQLGTGDTNAHGAR